MSFKPQGYNEFSINYISNWDYNSTVQEYTDNGVTRTPITTSNDINILRLEADYKWGEANKLYDPVNDYHIVHNESSHYLSTDNTKFLLNDIDVISFNNGTLLTDITGEKSLYSHSIFHFELD